MPTSDRNIIDLVISTMEPSLATLSPSQLPSPTALQFPSQQPLNQQLSSVSPSIQPIQSVSQPSLIPSIGGAGNIVTSKRNSVVDSSSNSVLVTALVTSGVVIAVVIIACGVYFLRRHNHTSTCTSSQSHCRYEMTSDRDNIGSLATDEIGIEITSIESCHRRDDKDKDSKLTVIEAAL
jgi:hypothetical protein